MPFSLAAILPQIILGATAAGAVRSLFGGGGGEVDFQTPPPIFPDQEQGKKQFGDYLFGNVGQGATPYGGPLSPRLDQTRLQDVWNAWQPMDFGTMFQARYLQNPFLQNRNRDLSNMMQFGGTGGPGNFAMSRAMQFGAPSEAGRPMSNLAHFGVASEGSGRGLANMAQFGVPSQGLGNLAMSFVQGRNPYRPAPVPLGRRF